MWAQLRPDHTHYIALPLCIDIIDYVTYNIYALCNLIPEETLIKVHVRI